MASPLRSALAVGSASPRFLLAACVNDPTGVAATSQRMAPASTASLSLAAGTLPTGERLLGQSSIEPAYNDVTGSLTYLLTPLHGPFPTHTSSHAVAPLYLVESPPGSTAGTLNCMGVPGNCPDHDGEVPAPP